MSAQLTAADVLERAADLIAKPGAWTQQAPARDVNGEIAGWDSPAACCWCAVGAIWRVTGDDLRLDLAAEQALEHTISGPIAAWNDTSSRTQAEVVAKLREAAALARAEAA